MVRGRFVLLVEDDEDLGSLIAETIRSEGYEVRWAQNGAEALATLDGGPALVLLDWSLPDSDPEEFAHLLRSRDIPFVLASGCADTTALAARVGAQATLDKPYDLSTLLRVLARFVGPPSEPAYS